MPCYDGREASENELNRRLVDQQQEQLQTMTERLNASGMRLENLAERNNVLMRCLCSVDKWARNSLIAQVEYQRFLSSNPEYSEELKKHRQFDISRRYEHYKDIYPGFSPDEINRMVEAGILSDI